MCGRGSGGMKNLHACLAACQHIRGKKSDLSLAGSHLDRIDRVHSRVFLIHRLVTASVRDKPYGNN